MPYSLAMAQHQLHDLGVAVDRRTLQGGELCRCGHIHPCPRIPEQNFDGVEVTCHRGDVQCRETIDMTHGVHASGEHRGDQGAPARS